MTVVEKYGLSDDDIEGSLVNVFETDNSSPSPQEPIILLPSFNVTPIKRK
jgi:hypothetical protein